MQKFDRALEDYAEALKRDPKHQATLLRRCWLRAIANKELEQAIVDCDQALALHKDDADVFESRCFVHLRMGNDAKALADCDAALKLQNKSSDALFLRALVKQRKGDAAGSKDDFAAAKKAEPGIEKRFAGYGVVG
jgi:tetratricopeptide (TPR) repeat protein